MSAFMQNMESLDAASLRGTQIPPSKESFLRTTATQTNIEGASILQEVHKTSTQGMLVVSHDIGGQLIPNISVVPQVTKHRPKHTRVGSGTLTDLAVSLMPHPNHM